MSISTSQYGHIPIIPLSFFNSSQGISLDSQNVCSKPKLDALSNGEEIFSKLFKGNVVLFNFKVKKLEFSF
jgi:hypothetical protein